MNNYLKKWNRVSIKSKMLITYGLVLMICSFISFSIFGEISKRIVENEVRDSSTQTLLSIDRNLEVVFNHINEVANVFFFDPDMQHLLSQIDSTDIDSKIQANIMKRLTNMALTVDFVSSVFIFDNYSNVYYSSYRPDRFNLLDDDVSKASWYDKVTKLNGDTAIIPNSGEFITKTTSNEKFISLIKNITSLDNYQKIGISVININESLIQDYFQDISGEYHGDFFIVDENNQFVISPINNQEMIQQEVVSQLSSIDENKIIDFENQDYLVSSLDSKVLGWKVYSVMPIQIGINTSHIENLIFFMVGTIILFFMLLCAIFFSRLIFKPLDEMQRYMCKVEKGEFTEIPIEPEKDNEITTLKHGFNSMVRSIDFLIQEIELEQKLIRKNELELIQAQINPHFLYNTLDAISALTLIEDYDNANKMITALGKFYRNSLNSGRDLITVKEEIECIKSYITILNIRYDNKIKLECHIEEDILELNILKLILQPIVENAVYHGIRQIIGTGEICIEGYRDEDDLIFVIKDNGVGITEEKIKTVLANKSQSLEGGFGVYSCMKRISIFYAIDQPMTIVSEMDWGTEITIRLKVIGE